MTRPPPDPEAEPPMIFSLRISLPDLPGTLGRVAGAFGKGDVNILTLDVVDREDGMAIDDLRVEAPSGMQEALRRAAKEVPGFACEYVRPLEAFGHVLEPLELAALLEESASEALGRLVEHLPDTFGATWALVVDIAAGPERPVILAASLGAPSAARLPASWLDFSGLGAALGGGDGSGQPVAHASEDDGLEVAAALLDRPTAAVLLGRERGPRFRAAEVRHLGLLARIAAGIAARADSLVVIL